VKFSLVSDPAFDSGLGHLSRLVALGQELRNRGDSYCFHPLDAFPSRHLEFISTNLLSIECLCGGNPDFMIIDTYNPNSIKEINKFGSRIVVQLVDEATPLGECDGYVEVSPTSKISDSFDGKPILKFEGSPLFRDEIYILKARLERVEHAENKGVLILGGVSSSTYIQTLSILQQSLGDQFQDLTVGVSSKVLAEIARKLGIRNTCSTQDMSFISKKFSYVISGAGVSAWELAFLEIPGFVISVADNQEFQLKYLRENGYRNGVSLSSKSIQADIFGCMETKNKPLAQIPSGEGRSQVLEFLKCLSR